MCKQCAGITKEYNRCEIKHRTKYVYGEYFCRHHIYDEDDARKRSIYENKQKRLKDAERSRILKDKKQEQKTKNQQDYNNKIQMYDTLELDLDEDIKSELHNKIMLLRDKAKLELTNKNKKLNELSYDSFNTDKLNKLSNNFSNNCCI